MLNDLLKKYWVYIVGIIFALAAALGILQSRHDPYSGYPNKPIGTAPQEKDLKAYYQQSKDIQTQQTDETTVTFFAVGDIMLSRNVAASMEKTNDYSLPFSNTKNLFSAADFAFGNLESPFYPISGNCADQGHIGIVGGNSLVFGAPCYAAVGLNNNKFKVLSLANNHAFDQGLKGMEWTQSLVRGIGVGKNLDEAWAPAVIDEKNIKICFIAASYASINDNGKTTNEYVARIGDLDRLKSGISYLKSTCDFIVASMHAGTEYTRKPNAAQTAFAHAAIDYGADMVIGHHPHWIQTIERYCPNSATELDSPSPGEGRGRGERLCPNPKYIFYSLGNFIFDQMWSQDTKEGLTLKIQISKSKAQNELQGPKVPASLDSIELVPIIIENYSTPRPATPEETKKILDKIGETNTILK